MGRVEKRLPRAPEGVAAGAGESACTEEGEDERRPGTVKRLPGRGEKKLPGYARFAEKRLVPRLRERVRRTAAARAGRLRPSGPGRLPVSSAMREARKKGAGDGACPAILSEKPALDDRAYLSYAHIFTAPESESFVAAFSGG